MVKLDISKIGLVYQTVEDKRSERGVSRFGFKLSPELSSDSGRDQAVEAPLIRPEQQGGKCVSMSENSLRLGRHRNLMLSVQVDMRTRRSRIVLSSLLNLQLTIMETSRHTPALCGARGLPQPGSGRAFGRQQPAWVGTSGVLITEAVSPRRVPRCPATSTKAE
ncbi:hypothetical protein RRG08_041119 [Elysia crispata]|uniref:Uncharacterized protein n=1 Tax=Elysia crispata TaxID=231223 RepID=A0AAE1CPK6_9GAST|nr:hypothetical protein RRG08_041119 [Elysia crispata]